MRGSFFNKKDSSIYNQWRFPMLRPVLFVTFLSVLFASPAESAFQRHVLETGVETYAYGYEETVSGSTVMETKGQYSGLFANYMLHSTIENEKFFELRLEGRWASGSVDYETNTFDYNGLNDYMYEIRGLAGMAFILPNGSTIMPYLGLGYRYLNNGLEELPADVTGTYSGYNRESRYKYVPLGVDWEMHIKNGWGFSMTLGFDWFIKGEQKSHLEDLRDISGNDPGSTTTAYNQDKGYGVRGALKLSKNFNSMEIFFVPFFRNWNVEATDYRAFMINGVEQYANEPSNTTREIGVKIGLIF